MISHNKLSEILGENVIKSLGYSEEYFFSLPLECQKVLIMNRFEANRIKQKEDVRKRMALKQYDWEEKVKEKVLSMIKKSK